MPGLFRGEDLVFVAVVVGRPGGPDPRVGDVIQGQRLAAISCGGGRCHRGGGGRGRDGGSGHRQFAELPVAAERAVGGDIIVGPLVQRQVRHRRVDVHVDYLAAPVQPGQVDPVPRLDGVVGVGIYPQLQVRSGDGGAVVVRVDPVVEVEPPVGVPGLLGGEDLVFVAVVVGRPGGSDPSVGDIVQGQRLATISCGGGRCHRGGGGRGRDGGSDAVDRIAVVPPHFRTHVLGDEERGFRGRAGRLEGDPLLVIAGQRIFGDQSPVGIHLPDPVGAVEDGVEGPVLPVVMQPGEVGPAGNRDDRVDVTDRSAHGEVDVEDVNLPVGLEAGVEETPRGTGRVRVVAVGDEGEGFQAGIGGPGHPVGESPGASGQGAGRKVELPDRVGVLDPQVEVVVVGVGEGYPLEVAAGTPDGHPGAVLVHPGDLASVPDDEKQIEPGMPDDSARLEAGV